MAVHGGNIEEIARKYNINPSEIIDFSANINPMGISKAVKAAMISSLNKVEHYPDITYYELKKSISEFEDINAENITLGNGAAEVIFNIVRALKPQKALLPAPTFSEYEEAILSVDGKIEYYILKEKNNFILDEMFIEAINDDIDIVFICNPNNPTGVLSKNTFIEKVLNKAIKTNTTVVVDESFLDFVEDNEIYTCKNLLKKYRNLMIVKSLTKFFAIPGIRIGYGLYANSDITEKLNKVTVPWSVNIVASDAVITGLKEKDYIKSSIENIAKEKEYLYMHLSRIEHIEVFKPSVNFIMFKLLSNLNLREELIKQKILVRSCSNYKGLSNKFYRVAVRSRRENERLINALGKICLKEN